MNTLVLRGCAACPGLKARATTNEALPGLSTGTGQLDPSLVPEGLRCVSRVPSGRFQPGANTGDQGIGA
jgi:hypothetical protein